MKIGMFDSGIGGLNVLKEFINRYPNNEYYYYGDTKNVPYGDKDKDILLELSTKIIRFFESKKVDLIIIACGTISSNCYLDLKKITNIKIIDIITPTIDFVKTLDFEKIAVLGTKRTIESHIFKKRLKKDILEVAPIEFVPMIENSDIDFNIVKKYTDSLNNPDVLILGCTHYPLLIKEISNCLHNNVIIVDMGVCLVNRIKIDNSTSSSIKLYFSKIDDKLLNNVSKILDCDYSITII